MHGDAGWVRSHGNELEGWEGEPEPLTAEEMGFREYHLTVEIPEHHWAAPDPSDLLRRADAHALQELHDLVGAGFAQPVHGFDVSSYQPAGPDFSVGGRRLAIFKATESLSYFDPHFAANRARAHALGLPFIGIYHFARPGSSSGAAQARYLLSKVGQRQAGEVIILDFEVSPWSVPWIVDFLTTIHAAGWPTEFYSYLGMLSANPTSGIPDTGTGLWVAAYGCREPGSDRWPAKDLWQHTDGQAGVCGNDGPWDCSVGELSSLLARAGTAPAPPAPIFSDEEDDMSTTVIEPAAWRKAQGLPEEVPVAVPPANSGGARWRDVWGSLFVDNFGDPTTDVRVMIKTADGDPTHWYAPTGADGDTVHCQSGRGTAPGQAWKFKDGDAGVSFINRGKHPVSFLVETAPR